MTGLFYKIFKCSFDALRAYENTADFNDWVSARNGINYRINTLVFKYIVHQHTDSKAAANAYSQQFYLDTINTLLKKHYHRRLKIYRFAKQEQLFCLLSVAFTWLELFRRILSSILKCRYSFTVEAVPVSRGIDVCIGFPSHAFSYQEDGNYTHPRSFAEFLLKKTNTSPANGNMLSIDEFERRSKQHEKGELSVHAFPSGYARERVGVTRSKHAPGTTAALIRKIRREYRLHIEKPNLFLAAGYFEQAYTERRYLSVFKQLEARGNHIGRIYVLSFLDLGLMKYKSDYSNRTFIFSYSQNLFVPPAQKISQCLLQGVAEMEVKDILSECESTVLSFDTHHPVGFTGHCSVIHHFKSMINASLGLCLPVAEEPGVGVAVNLGYESFTRVEMEDGVKNILLFDVPIEKKERDLGRAIMGDKTAKEDFMSAFYEDIVSLSEKYGCRIFLKPKYSLSSPEFPLSYKSLIREVQEKAGDRFRVLDPYTVMETNGGKIDLGIHFPFTSTYYSMADTCVRSVYYAPSPYSDSFFQHADAKLVLGKERLENIIKYL